MYEAAFQSYPWLLGLERFDPRDYHPEDLECIPEIGLDDGDGSDEDGDCNSRKTLTLTNTKDVTNICFVTVWDVDLCGRDGANLQSGWNETRHNTGDSNQEQTSRERRKCTTFIVLCPPRTFVHLCYLAPNQFCLIERSDCDQSAKNVSMTSWSQVEIESDIQPWSRHEGVNDEHSTLIHFPFYEQKTFEKMENMGKDLYPASALQQNRHQQQRYQCIQSESGQLTHFFHGNYHAIDFACPVGTPLYSPFDGVVVTVHDGGDAASIESRMEVSGIAATNLFHWNSIMIRADETTGGNSPSNPLYVEYVHIQSRSCVVQSGEHVTKGQLLCKSGSVGFSPVPHLHLGAYRSGEDGASTVRVRFECVGRKDEASFLPVAGGWYNETGLACSPGLD